MARAVIEGVCLALRDLVEGLVAIGAPISEIRVAGGAARSHQWLRILASVLGRPVRPTSTPDASAYGAGLLALALETGTEVAEVAAACVAPGPTVEPNCADAAIYSELHAVYRSLYTANRDAMHELARLDAVRSPA
jgi:sugar (pentulose or hexulose) kinase